ncbi:MAG: hypothetical protein D6818_06105 [Bacteroidetes bacterium]|nr:MAG: hypothetical protein D6818_06105 [Bacteroidota bacterium]
MTHTGRSYHRSLTLFGLGFGVVSFALHYFVDPLHDYAWYALSLFIIFYVLAWVSGSLALRLLDKEDGQAFIRFVMAVAGFKMLLAIVLLVGFDRIFHPPDKWYGATLGLTYLAFTIFETRAMMQLGRDDRLA